MTSNLNHYERERLYYKELVDRGLPISTSAQGAREWIARERYARLYFPKSNPKTILEIGPGGGGESRATSQALSRSGTACVRY